MVPGLWLGPAERADVIVDFSQFAGRTLILYNDAPTPAPAIDSRLDYFTSDGDQTPIGGAPSTAPGYGPNTRTIMQVVVDGTAPNAVPFSLSALKAAFASSASVAGLFASTQPTTIVPEPAYNSAYNGNFPAVYAPISANTLTFKPIVPLTFEALLSAEPSACTGSTTPPTQCASLNHKTIQELFTLDYGRMNATLGTELPNVNFQNQTTIHSATSIRRPRLSVKATRNSGRLPTMAWIAISSTSTCSMCKSSTALDGMVRYARPTRTRWDGRTPCA